MKKVLLTIISVCLIAASIFGLFAGVTSISDIMNVKEYKEKDAEEGLESIDTLDAGLDQLQENEGTYLAGVDTYTAGLVSYSEGKSTLSAGYAAYYAGNEPRGEYVLVVAGRKKQDGPQLTLEQGAERVLRLREGGMRMKDAVRQVADDTGLSRNDLYDAALKR